MQENITPYKDSMQGKKVQVEGMFDEISGSYDGFNRFMTFRLDVKWRKNVRKKIEEISAEKILDVATGTADLAIELAKIKNSHITGVDISKGMLAVGNQKIKKLNLEEKIQLSIADSENLPFQDHSFDAVSVSFGVRNFENLNKGLSEILRVLKPNGRLVILETSVPENFFLKQGYFLYTKFFLPFMGKLFSKDKNAYSYLSRSAEKFPYGKNFAEILKKVGFSKVKFEPQTLGVATIYIAEK